MFSIQTRELIRKFGLPKTTDVEWFNRYGENASPPPNWRQEHVFVRPASYVIATDRSSSPLHEDEDSFFFVCNRPGVIELPGGRVEPPVDFTSADTARREFLEETGRKVLLLSEEPAFEMYGFLVREKADEHGPRHCISLQRFFLGVADSSSRVTIEKKDMHCIFAKRAIVHATLHQVAMNGLRGLDQLRQQVTIIKARLAEKLVTSAASY